MIRPVRWVVALGLGAIPAACGTEAPSDLPQLDACIDDGICPATHPAGRTVTSVPVTGTPFGIAVSDSGEVYVTKLHEVAVGRSTIPLTGAVTASFPVADVPTDVGFVPGLPKAYVTNRGANNVSVINTATDLQTNLLPIGTLPYRVLSTAGNRTYITFGASALKVLNSSTDAVIDSIAVSGGPNGLVLSPNGNTLYVSNTGGMVSIINTASLTVDSFLLAGKPQDIAISPDGQTLYVANEDLGVQRVDLVTRMVTGTIAVPAFSMRMTPDDVQLWVAKDETITVIDRAAFTSEPSIAVPGGIARRIAFGRNGRMVLVANEGGFISVIQ
jgi:YVTN family beta-propeller protein